MNLKRLLLQTARGLGLDIGRYNPGFPTGIVSLPPEGISRGNVLLAYILEPFLSRRSKSISTSHTHHGESMLIADTWLQQGYSVDVIDYRNHEFVSQKRYDFLVSARTHLATIAARLDPECVKVAHLDTSHFANNNHATYSRLLDLQRRRGLSLPQSARFVEPNSAIEHANYGVVLGNEITLGTYRYANKPLFPLDVPAAHPFPQDIDKDFAGCRNQFLWFGSGGMVHKGLDLTLEAFTGLPEMRLTVCGPVEAEKEFVRAYSEELYRTPNIRAVGWVDVAGEDFLHIVKNTVGIIYPSCAEGQAGSVVNCLAAGLIPIVSRESGIPVNDFGVLLDNCTVENVRNAVRKIAALSDADLAIRARKTWEYAKAYHSHDAYRVGYGKIVQAIIADSGKQSFKKNRVTG